MTEMKKLNWTQTSPNVEVASLGTTTWILTRDREAGRKNRFTLVRLLNGKYGEGYAAVRLGCELPPGMCRKLAEKDAGLML